MLNKESRCYTDGAIGEIVGQDGQARWVVLVHEVFNVNRKKPTELVPFTTSKTCYSIDKGLVEEFCADVFTIGEEVQAVYPGNQGFQGTVVGFEPSSNRVICSSSSIAKNPASRSRYAYRVEEISARTPTMSFQLNHKYRSKSGQVFRTVEAPRTEKMTLIEDCSGKFIMYVDAEETKEYVEQRIPGGLVDASVKNYQGGR